MQIGKVQNKNIEGNEKNTRYFANQEDAIQRKKVLRLKINDTYIIEQSEILKEEVNFFKNVY